MQVGFKLQSLHPQVFYVATPYLASISAPSATSPLIGPRWWLNKLLKVRETRVLGKKRGKVFIFKVGPPGKPGKITNFINLQIKSVRDSEFGRTYKTIITYNNLPSIDLLA